jgi:DNA-directed RNA polymerase specialized sigma24 family protein
MCALVSAAAKWTGEGDFRAWAYAAIRNHLINVRKHQSRVAVEYASAGVIERLDRQDRDEELSWARHINSRGWSPCEQDRLSYTPSLSDDD